MLGARDWTNESRDERMDMAGVSDDELTEEVEVFRADAYQKSFPA